MDFGHLQFWIAHYGYAGIFVLLMLGIVGLPVPDETLLTLTGYLVYKGTLHLWLSYAVAFLGTTCGITISYGIGRLGGVAFLRRFGPKFHVTDERIRRVHEWFDRRGRWTLTVGYFVPGFRHLIAIIAGSSGLQISHFGLFAYSGAALWSVFFITAGYFLGEGWAEFPGLMHRIGFAGFILVVVASGLYWLRRARRQKRSTA